MGQQTGFEGSRDELHKKVTRPLSGFESKTMGANFSMSEG
jgi:hypothetical protein